MRNPVIQVFTRLASKIRTTMATGSTNAQRKRTACTAEAFEPRVLLAAAPFLPAQVYPTAPIPREMAIADFNGDGKPDIATVIAGGGEVAILLNNGDGTFARPHYLVTGFPRSIAAADFNHDGHVDLAVAGFNGNNGAVVQIFNGNGDGTFVKPPQHYPLFGTAPAIVAADLNGDGFADLVVATHNRVAVLINQTNGTFAPPVYYNTGNDHPSALAVADFNNDGLPDLAVLRGQSNSVTVLLNNKGAPGTFGAPMFSPVGGNALAMTVGDFNHDGSQDLAVVNSNFRGVTLAVLLGNGDGTFRPRASYSGVDFSDAIASADFTGSGNADIVVGSFTGPLKLYAGNGDGTFATPVNVPDALYAQVVEPADLNGDGRPDLVVTPAGGVRVLLNSGHTITPPPPGQAADQTIGAGAPRSFRFYAPDGTIATVALQGPGTATLHFSSSATISVPKGREFIQVTGLQLAGITLSGTTIGSTLSIAANYGSRTVTFGAIAADSAVGSIDAPTANLTGAVALPGGVRQVALLSATDGSISIGAGPPPKLALGQTNNETISSAVPIESLGVKLDAGVNLTAPSIGTLEVGGQLHDSSIALTLPFAARALDLARLSATAGISMTTIQSAGNIGAVIASNLLDSAIDAGVGALPPGQRLPTAASEFAAPAAIASVSLLGNNLHPSFANSVVIATQQGGLNLGTIQTSNGGVPFGVGAHTIASLAGRQFTTGKPFRLVKITSAAQVTAAFAAKGIFPQDFTLEIV